MASWIDAAADQFDPAGARLVEAVRRADRVVLALSREWDDLDPDDARHRIRQDAVNTACALVRLAKEAGVEVPRNAAANYDRGGLRPPDAGAFIGRQDAEAVLSVEKLERAEAAFHEQVMADVQAHWRSQNRKPLTRVRRAWRALRGEP